MKPHRKLFRHSPALLVLGLALSCVAPALAQRTEYLRDNSKMKAAFRETVAKPNQSVVRILVDDKDAALGTVVGADGWIVTKASLLKSDKIACKLKDGKKLDAKVVGVHDAHDLAMLKIDARNLAPIEWKTSKEAVVGNWVASAGPDQDPVAIGVVSVAARDVPVKSYPPSFMPNSGFLGVTMADITGGGVKITTVREGSAAAKAGIKDGDIVLSVNSKPVNDMDEMRSMLQKHKSGETVTIRIRRDKDEQDLKATLGSPPAEMSRGDFQNTLGGHELSDKRTGFPSILQHDTFIKPKDCGGPVVDLDGKAVGINIARAGRTETYAIPTDALQVVLVDLKSGKLRLGVLEAAVKKHEELIKTNEAYRDGLKKLVAQAEELKAKYGKDDKELLDVHARTVEKLKSTEAELVKFRAELAKAQTELKKAQEKEPAPKSEK